MLLIVSAKEPSIYQAWIEAELTEAIGAARVRQINGVSS
jgi:hypothetical protein